MPPQLKVVAAIIATVAVIWAIAALRGPADDGTAAVTGDAGSSEISDTAAPTASLLVGAVRQNAGATTVAATLTSASAVDEVVWNHVWIVHDGLEFPEATAFIGCLAADDQLGKPLSGLHQVATPVADATACGLGGFALAPGATATIEITAAGLTPGSYRVLIAAWTSEPFTVA